MSKAPAFPAWTKGFDLEFLREVTAVFKRHGESDVKERDIADAMQDRSLCWTLVPDSRSIAAAAIAKRQTKSSTHEDFAGRKVEISAGHLFVKAIAGDPDGVERVINGLLNRAGAETVWVEASVEDTELTGALRRLGFRHVVTKVAAGSDLKGMYVRGNAKLPSDLVAAADLHRLRRGGRA